MSAALKERLLSVIYEALYEINEIIGYEYIDRKKVKKNKELFLQLLALGEKLLEEKRGVTLKDLENEPFDHEKVKGIVLLGLFHGFILRDAKGKSFEEKFENYLYSSSIERCEWIEHTGYNNYYQSLFSLVSKICINTNKIKFVFDFSKLKLQSTSQGITKIQTKRSFFKSNIRMTETTVDEHLDIFRELGAVTETFLKMLYGIKYNYTTTEQIQKLEKKEFYEIWKDLRDDSRFNLFTKPFPNTICWNASKHNGVFKIVGKKEIEFKSNEGSRTLSYRDFFSLVREIYACIIVLLKITLMIRFQTKIY